MNCRCGILLTYKYVYVCTVLCLNSTFKLNYEIHVNIHVGYTDTYCIS